MKISMMRSNEGESNGCKEICSNVTERRILKRIKTIINKLLNCIFCKKVKGPWPPSPLSSNALYGHYPQGRLRRKSTQNKLIGLLALSGE